ncbi:DUF2141 domain-containing protein [Flammeovirga sp. SJP92]|uniref:DUF2141 domain-containing protein n=1 Tax=Flammeovirga sp. SJP92 TaxID=1775430 RepID=UPI0007873A6A|nr:DUF2141 domain-containing protein [Flammeovirga sp. SJP92]KXX68332.1 hypothetical protein AVL50_21360 [Flammeovirga sp. SJP92]
MKNIILGTLLLLTFNSLFAQSQSKIELTVEGLRNTKGHILVQVVDKNMASIVELKQKVLKDVVEISIPDIKPGTYGIRICHDEDNNDEMTNNWIGIPKEGFGYSWDKKVKMKEPDFEEYAFILEKENNALVNIKLQYL